MSKDIKDQLIRLGAQQPDLRGDIRPILAHIRAKEAGTLDLSEFRLPQKLAQKWGLGKVTFEDFSISDRYALSGFILVQHPPDGEYGPWIDIPSNQEKVNSFVRDLQRGLPKLLLDLHTVDDHGMLVIAVGTRG